MIEPIRSVKIGRNDPCWCDSGKKYKKCHLASDRLGKTSPPAAAAHPAASDVTAPAVTAPKVKKTRKPKGVQLKTADEIEGIRRAGRLTMRPTCPP